MTIITSLTTRPNLVTAVMPYGFFICALALVSNIDLKKEIHDLPICHLGTFFKLNKLNEIRFIEFVSVFSAKFDVAVIFLFPITLHVLLIFTSVDTCHKNKQ